MTLKTARSTVNSLPRVIAPGRRSTQNPAEIIRMKAHNSEPISPPPPSDLLDFTGLLGVDLARIEHLFADVLPLGAACLVFVVEATVIPFVTRASDLIDLD